MAGAFASSPILCMGAGVIQQEPYFTDPIKTKDLYVSWLTSARNGDTFVYFRNDKGLDTLTDHWDYRELFDLVYASSVNREVVLLQRRLFVPAVGYCLDYYALKVSATAPVRLFPKRDVLEFS